jgi:hypothetical protein
MQRSRIDGLIEPFRNNIWFRDYFADPSPLRQQYLRRRYLATVYARLAAVVGYAAFALLFFFPQWWHAALGLVSASVTLMTMALYQEVRADRLRPYVTADRYASLVRAAEAQILGPGEYKLIQELSEVSDDEREPTAHDGSMFQCAMPGPSGLTSY